MIPAPPNYPLRHLKYQLIQTIRPLIEVHWGGLGAILGCFVVQTSFEGPDPYLTD